MKLLLEKQDIQYELFNLNALDEMAALMADTFVRHEPMTSLLEVPFGVLEKFIKIFGPKAEQEEVSIVARDQKTGRVIGAMLSEDLVSPAPEGIDQFEKQLGPIFALLDALKSRYMEGKSSSMGQYLHLFMIAVDSQYAGAQVGQNMSDVSLENGIRKGYHTALAEATGTISQHILRKSGFVERLHIPYKTFEYRGRRIFETIQGHTGVILMDKTLVPKKS